MTGPSTTTSATAPRSESIVLPTRLDDGFHMTALTAGLLSSDGRCFWLGAGSNRIDVIWPQGYRAARDPLRVLDRRGKVIGRVGKRVTLGGGFARLTPKVVASIPTAVRDCVQPLQSRQPDSRGPGPTVWIM